MADIEGVVLSEDLVADPESTSVTPSVKDVSIEGMPGLLQDAPDALAFDDADNMSLVIRAKVHETIANFNQSIPIANEFEWYRNTFVEPNRRIQKSFEDRIKWANDAEELAGRVLGGFTGISLSIGMDSLIGGAVVKGLKMVNPAAAAAVTALRANGARYLPDWAIGMATRNSLQTFNVSDHDIISSGIALFESLTIGAIFASMPPGIVKGGHRMFATGIGLRAYEDLKEGKLSDVKEYVFAGAESFGLHLALTAQHQLNALAHTPYERTIVDALAVKLKAGKVSLQRIEEMLADPKINDEMKDKIRDLRTAVTLEMQKTMGYVKEKGFEIPWEEILGPESGFVFDKPMRLQSAIMEQVVTEMMDKWAMGEVEMNDFFEKTEYSMIADAIDLGAVTYDERARTWEWNRDIVTQPDSNIVIGEDGIKYKNAGRRALGSPEFPATAETRGVDYIVDRLGQAVVGEQVTAAGGKKKASAFPKAERELIERFLKQWQKVNPAILESLTVEVWNREEFVKRAAMELHYTRGISEERAYSHADMTGVMGEYNYPMLLIDMFLPFYGGDRYKAADVFAHEFGHHLNHFIPEGYTKALLLEWDSRRISFLTQFPPEVRNIFLKVWNNQPVTPEERQFMKTQDLHEWYRFSNPMEFWAETVRDMFRLDYRGEDFDPNSRFGRLILSTKEVLQLFLREIETQLGTTFGPSIARSIYREMLKGNVRTATQGFFAYPGNYFNQSGLRGVPFFTVETVSPGRTEDFGQLLAAQDLVLEKELATQGIPEVLQNLDPDTFDIRYQEKLRLKTEEGKPSPEINKEMLRDIAGKLWDADNSNQFRPELFRGLNPMHLMTNSEAQQIMRGISEVAGEFIDEKRGGFEPRKETLAKAKEMTTDLKWIQKLQKRTANLARDITAARLSLLYSVQRLVSLKSRVLADDATQADADALDEWMKIHTELQANVQGSISNIARALGSLNINAFAKDIFEAQNMDDLVKIVNKRSPWQLLNAWVEVFKGWLFSNPATHGVNFGGNLAVQVGNITEDYIATGLGRVLGSEDAMSLREANAKTVATLTGAVAGARYFGELLATSYAVAKERGMRAGEDVLNEMAIAPYEDKWNPDTKSWTHKSIWGELPPDATTFDILLAKSFDSFGIISRAPLNALGLSDNFFREVSFMRKVTEFAIKEGLSKGLEGPELQDYTNNFITAHKMLFEQNLRPLNKEQKEFVQKYVGEGVFFRKAFDAAKEDVFARDFRDSSGTLGSAIAIGQSAVQKMTPLQIIFPTFKTPLNILRYVGQRTPGLHKLSSEMTADIQAGGRRRDMAYAKLTYGMMLYGLGLALAMSGHAVGLFDKKTTESELTSGLTKDSLVVGGKSYSLTNSDPIGSFIMLPARMLHIMKNSFGVDDGKLIAFGQEIDWFGADATGTLGKTLGSGGRRMDLGEAITAVIVAFSSLYTDKTFNRQLKEVLDAISGERPKSGMRWVNNTATLLTVPMNGLLRFLHGGQGAYMREAEGFLDTWQKATAPTYVKPRYNIYGEPIEDEGKFMGTIPRRTVSTSDVDRELMRLEVPVSRLADDKWRKVELTDDEKRKYNDILRTLDLREALDDLIHDPIYQDAVDRPGSLDPGSKGYLLNLVISRYRRAAWGILVAESEDTDHPLPALLEEELMNPYSARPGNIGMDRMFRRELEGE